jgi:hypothetical protein
MDTIRSIDKSSKSLLKIIRKGKEIEKAFIKKHTDRLTFLERKEKVIVDDMQLTEDMDRKLKYDLEPLNETIPIDQVPDDDD